MPALYKKLLASVSERVPRICCSSDSSQAVNCCHFSFSRPAITQSTLGEFTIKPLISSRNHKSLFSGSPIAAISLTICSYVSRNTTNGSWQSFVHSVRSLANKIGKYLYKSSADLFSILTNSSLCLLNKFL